MTLRVYSAAKTVVDCFKHRNEIGLDVAMEALKDAWRYAKVCRVANVMRPYMKWSPMSHRAARFNAGSKANRKYFDGHGDSLTLKALATLGR